MRHRSCNGSRIERASRIEIRPHQVKRTGTVHRRLSVWTRRQVQMAANPLAIRLWAAAAALAGPATLAWAAFDLPTRDAMPPSSAEQRWLGATSVHSTDFRLRDHLHSIRALCRVHLQLSVHVNYFDRDKPTAKALSAAQGTRLNVSWIPGMKVLFWRKVLTTERTSGLDALWLFDSDVAVHPSVFPLGMLVAALHSTNATILQPAVRGEILGSYHRSLKTSLTHMSCLATTTKMVELMTPIFAADAWAFVLTEIISIWSDDEAGASAYGLDVVWCHAIARVFLGRPTCLVRLPPSVLSPNAAPIAPMHAYLGEPLLLLIHTRAVTVASARGGVPLQYTRHREAQ